MIEAKTALKLNIILLVITAGVFGYILRISRPKPAASTDATPVVLASPASMQPTHQVPKPSPTGTTTPLPTLTQTPAATYTPAPSSTPTPTPTAPPTRTPQRMARYIVEEGDSLSEIAMRYDITVEEIVLANALEDPNRLYIGQVLLIPQRITPTPSAAPTP